MSEDFKSIFDGPTPSEDETRRAYEALGLVYRRAKETLTEEEGWLLYEVSNQYWHDFSKLVNDTLAKVPEDIRAHLEYQLQDKSSVFGRYTDGESFGRQQGCKPISEGSGQES